ncbi:MAG: class II glutamine amidotransferase [Candidatus Helarchaeota archaeon]
MCGIAGVISEYHSPHLISNLLTILSNLVNRGKDGTGICYIDHDGTLKIHKEEIASPVFTEKFNSSINCNLAIGHVRLPTVGPISELNSHPVTDCSETIAVVHNGTIRNYKELKENLTNEGHIFRGSVDSEVIPHLIEKNFHETKNIKNSIQNTIKELEGYYTFSLISIYEPQKIYLYRQHFPLILYKDGSTIYFSSERKPLAQLLKKSFRAKHLKENELVILEKSTIK